MSLTLMAAAFAGVAVLGGAPALLPVPDFGSTAPSHQTVDERSQQSTLQMTRQMSHGSMRQGDGTSLPGAARAPSRAGAGSAPRLDRHRLHVMRAATRRFHDIANAETSGYGLLKDVNGLTCIDMPGVGGMGVHYVNGDVVKDPTLHPATPEALVYAPGRDGTLRLAALEFIVDKAAWDSNHAHRPKLFAGHPFDLTSSPNRFGLAPFYSQHVWVWKHNRAGTLAMWNPAVSCACA